mgnify:FL=1
MADPAVYNAILEENRRIQKSIQDAAAAAALAALATEPWNSDNWNLIPLLDSPTGCLCVTDTGTGQLRCGTSCTWTVPAGTTQAQFQLWGAGAGTANGMCCAGSPYGQNGAFASTIIDVTPGDQYTLCGGCAYCCWAGCSSQNTTCGMDSYATGNGLTGFCANGGCSRLSCGMKALHASYGQCRWRGTGSSEQSGPCICAGGSHYCFANSCATCGLVPFIAGTEQTYRGTSTGTVVGLPGIWGSGCFDTNHYGYFMSPPVIGPCHTAQTNSSACYTYSSGSCCGGCRCRADLGHRCFPGAGGAYTHMMGGAMYYCGDIGRAGMVRVTWK